MVSLPDPGSVERTLISTRPMAGPSGRTLRADRARVKTGGQCLNLTDESSSRKEAFEMVAWIRASMGRIKGKSQFDQRDEGRQQRVHEGSKPSPPAQIEDSRASVDVD